MSTTSHHTTLLTEQIIQDDASLQAAILELKLQKNALILAHYYQESAIQDIADYKGDSLGLARQAKATDADMIVFAGVHFMAETAKILNPSKKVLLPDLKAGCSLEMSCPPQAFKRFIEQHPGHTIVSYINCSAEVKALSDIICTSSNAVKIVNQIPTDQPIIFAPDKNLARYVIQQTGRDNIVVWDGACIVHEAFSIEKLLDLYTEHPDAQIIAHPECEDHILQVANFIGSTSALLKHIKSSPHDKFIIATEVGILHEMQKAAPQKTLIPAPSKENNTCACSECEFMKMNTLEKLFLCLKHESPEITLPQHLMINALKPIQRMLEMS